MKILMINKSDHGGGAAIASTGLADSLKEYCGCDVMFASAKAIRPDTFELRGKCGWIIEESIDRITRKAGFEYGFLPFSRRGILKAVKEFKPDIINIHNIHSGYFETELLEKLGDFAPVVWSIHDMWALTGHCTVTKGCSKWMTGCGKCPNLDVYPALGIDGTAELFKRKMDMIQKTDIIASAPSKWIYDSLEKSPMWKNKLIESINYGIDEKLFKPMEKNLCRHKFGIDQKAFVILLTAEKLSGKTKGEDIIENILEKTAEKIKNEVILLTGGKSTLQFSSSKFRHIHAGYLNRNDMPFLYNATDVNASPTAGEAFGLTIVEAGLCNIPSVVFDAGGTVTAMGEIQSDNLVPSGSIEEFSNKMIYLSTQPAKNLRDFYIENFSLRKSAENFHALFKRILKEK